MKPATKKLLRSLFIRTSRDNKIRYDGFLFYVFLVTGLLVLGFILSRPKNINSHQARLGMPATIQRGPPAKVDTRRAETANESFTEIAPLTNPNAEPLTHSERVETREPDAVAPEEKQEATGFLDTIREAAIKKKPTPAEADAQNHNLSGQNTQPNDGVIREHGIGLRGAENSQAEVASEVGVGDAVPIGQPLQISTGSLDPATLTVYHRDDTEAKPAAAPSGFDTGNFLPKGQLIPIVFETNVTTLDLSGMVEMQVDENVKFNGDVIRLPYGTKLYGTASTKNVADRIAVTVDTIVFTDGTELAIDGVVLDEDSQPGVRGYYVPQPPGVQAFPYVTGALTGALQALVQQQQVVTQSPLGVSTQSQNPNSLKTVAYSAGQQALTDAFTKEQTMLDQRYPPYVIVKRGSTAYVQLSSALDLNARRINQPKPDHKSSGGNPTAPAPLPPAVQQLLSKLGVSAN
jgi:hypothetical protein